MPSRFGGLSGARSKGEWTVKLDDFLEQHSAQAGVHAIIEPGSVSDAVKVTAWSASTGCSCASALEIPRHIVADVQPTDITHPCCGKLHKVAVLRFAKGSEFMADVLSQLTK